jgi:arginine deiminase
MQTLGVHSEVGKLRTVMVFGTNWSSKAGLMTQRNDGKTYR